MWPVLVCAIAVFLLLIAEARQSAPGKWATKPVAAACYIWLALDRGAITTPYGRWVLLALALCWLGDLLLIPRHASHWFRLGLVAFLLGHLAYALAFLELGVSHIGLAIGATLFAGVGWLVWRWLDPHVSGRMRWPVRAYVIVISLMAALALATVAAGSSALIAVGAIGFMISDLGVARNRFVTPGLINRAWGLPLYFASQLLLAYSVG